MLREVQLFLGVDVECHAGYRGEETPRRFRIGEHQIEIAEVVDSLRPHGLNSDQSTSSGV